MRPDLTAPPKLSLGDRVAVVSPSFAAPALFPAVHELAMQRLRDEVGLVPVAYPTTRQPAAMAVFGVDIGHTDAQWIVPYGGSMTVDGPARRITAHY
jgi:muramoyltetrapeptide carboxypeptidase LdcA involved in peptidoglycan recycling